MSSKEPRRRRAAYHGAGESGALGASSRGDEIKHESKRVFAVKLASSQEPKEHDGNESLRPLR